MHVYAQLYATKYPINGSMFVNSPMVNNRKTFVVSYYCYKNYLLSYFYFGKMDFELI